jgi:hypothetical protein
MNEKSELPGATMVAEADDLLDYRRSSSETLTPGDADLAGDIINMKLPDVPEIQQIAIAIADFAHTPAKLNAFIECFEKAGPKALRQLLAAPRGPHSKDRRSRRLPPVCIRDETANNFVSRLEKSGHSCTHLRS